MARRFSEIHNPEPNEIRSDEEYRFSGISEEEHRLMAEDLEKNPPSLGMIEELENEERIEQEKNRIISSQRNSDITIEPYELGEDLSADLNDDYETIFSNSDDNDLYNDSKNYELVDFSLEDSDQNSFHSNENEVFEDASKHKVDYLKTMAISETYDSILSGASNFNIYIDATDDVNRGFSGAYADAVKHHQYTNNLLLHNDEVRMLYDSIHHNVGNLEDVKLEVAQKTLDDYLKFHESRFIIATRDGASRESYFVQLDRNMDIPINGKLTPCIAGCYINITNAKDKGTVRIVGVNDFEKYYHNVEYSRDAMIMADVTKNNVFHSLMLKDYSVEDARTIAEQSAVKTDYAFDLSNAINKRLRSADVPLAIYPNHVFGNSDLVLVHLDRDGAYLREVGVVPMPKDEDLKAKTLLGVIRDKAEDRLNPYCDLCKSAFEACDNIPLMDNLSKIERLHRFEQKMQKDFENFKKGVPSYTVNRDSQNVVRRERKQERNPLKPRMSSKQISGKEISDRGI